jgi:hypothetical protein
MFKISIFLTPIATATNLLTLLKRQIFKNRCSLSSKFYVALAQLTTKLAYFGR